MPTIRERDGKFQAIVRVKSGGQIVHQESRTFDREALAIDWGRRLEAAIKKGGVPGRKLAKTTMDKLLEDYLVELEKHQGVRRTRSHEINQLATELRGVPLAGLTSNTLVEFAERRRKEGAGPTTILHNLSTIRSVLNAAKPMFGLDISGEAASEAIAALGRVGAVSASKHRDRRPTEDELDRIRKEYQRIASYPSTLIPMDTIVSLAVALPRRLGELLDMRWEDYDKKAGIIKLRNTKHPRKPRTEVVPLPPEARRIIDSLPVIDERMLPYKSESASVSFERITERLGIVNLRFHDLRHEGITRLFERGLSIPEVATISGHKSWAMLRRYANLDVAAIAEKMNVGQQKAQETGSKPA